MLAIKHIFTYSLFCSIFPDCWKRFVVCPNPNIKNPSLPYYKQIAISPTLSKERIVYEQVQNYLKENTLWNAQFACKRKHSTQINVIKVE